MNKEVIDQYELNEIIEDTHCGGKFIIFYQQLQESLSCFSHKRIGDMRSTLAFDNPLKDFSKYDKMKIIYLYSLLP